MKHCDSVHSETRFIPADYEVVDYIDNKPPAYAPGYMNAETYRLARQDWEREIRALFPKGNYHRCEHCGQTRVRYVVACRHIPSGEIVCFGDVCVARLGFRDHSEFRASLCRSEGARRDKAEKLARDVAETLEKNPAFAEVYREIKKEKSPLHSNGFIVDVVGRLDYYGGLSERQIEAVVRSAEKALAFARKREGERAAARPIEAGRHVVEGEVLSTKLVSTTFGETLKMMLKLADGARVWMSVPGRLNVEKGMRVRVTVTIEPSPDDPSFGFGSRPSKASILP